jgi:tRNA nucleotidyltransferase (CCA-adding enzyme)|uniref:CBS domain-containing protein n=1 Tax=Desulfobacca acetoxidans TaxID=60893 RepID=A0A7V6DQD9_9BACT
MSKNNQAPAARTLEVITTHLNADFDALASMVAAKKLYPEALLVFPGAQEGNLRDFFIRSSFYFLDFARAKNVAPEEIKRLILVDTRQLSRIGKFAEAAISSDVDIHIYDHHPDSPEDVHGSLEVVQPLGSTTAILTKILEERHLDPTPQEATIMALGLFEDTGSFTFSSTTPQDFEAAAYLLRHGADLNVVSQMVTRELTTEQVSLLNDLIAHATRFTVDGIEVVLASTTASQYVADFSVLAHKYMDMENLQVLFALAQMEDRVFVVGRSRVPEVNVGEILAEMGGGGHEFAASAAIKDKPLAQVEQSLRKIIQQKVRPLRRARDIMSFPVKSVPPNVSLEKAEIVLNRYSINALPVVQEAKLLGLISRQTVEKGIFHGLKNHPVKDYMSTPVATVGPEDTLAEIREKLVVNKQRLLPVIQEGEVVGVISRTDLLNLLIDTGDESEDTQWSQPLRKKNILSLMRERLPKKILNILAQVGQVAKELGFHAYVVGGFVRDLFIKQENLDIDLVIEGDGIAFAKTFAARHGARARVFQKFKTAVIIFPDGFKMDVATARTEYYDFPGALPVVEYSSIKMDLYRRDFTINTLAVNLNPEEFGTLLDFFGAHRDLKERRISVLHNLSFVEDPTRVFRAIRFEQRFGFRISKLTINLINNAVKNNFFDRLSGVRLFHELELILHEENPIPAIARLAEFDLLRPIHPRLWFDEGTRAMLERVRAVIAWMSLSYLEEHFERWLVYFLGLVEPLNPEEIKELMERFKPPPRLAEAIMQGKEAADQALHNLFRLGDKASRSEVYRLLNPIGTEFLLYMMAKSRQEPSRRLISLYFTHLKHLKPELTGRDLVALGFQPGPEIRAILNRLHEARLNEEVQNKREELELIKRTWGKKAAS